MVSKMRCFLFCCIMNHRKRADNGSQDFCFCFSLFFFSFYCEIFQQKPISIVHLLDLVSIAAVEKHFSTGKGLGFYPEKISGNIGNTVLFSWKKIPGYGIGQPPPFQRNYFRDRRELRRFPKKDSGNLGSDTPLTLFQLHKTTQERYAVGGICNLCMSSLTLLDACEVAGE